MVVKEFGLEIYFRQRWTDTRLNYTEDFEEVAIPAHSVDRIWVPDLYFPNEKSGSVHMVTTPNRVIKIFPGSHVRYSAR